MGAKRTENSFQRSDGRPSKALKLGFGFLGFGFLGIGHILCSHFVCLRGSELIFVQLSL